MHFLRRHISRYRKQITGFDSASLQALSNYPWPGNVRELDHTVERAVLMAQGDTVHASDLDLRSGSETVPKFEAMTLDDAECLLIKKAISRLGGDMSKVAEALGLSRGALYRRLEKYGIR